MNNTTQKNKTLTLLERFNNKDNDAFEEVYSMLYKELYYFSHSLYKGTEIDAKDVIQDAFLEIWQNNHRKFDKISGIKFFLLIVIKNGYKMYYNRNRFRDKVKKDLLKDDNFFMMQATEAEVFSLIPSALNLLPEECARSFQLFLDGWEVKDIAEKLGKQPSTIYNQRKESIKILRKKISKNHLSILLILLTNIK